MNIFFIPSWYPSKTDALPGIFFRDQALAIARHFPDVNIGISIWGQNDDRLLLWSRKPFQSMKKWINGKPKSSIKYIYERQVVEYFTPTYTWSYKLKEGNMSGIIHTNKVHLAEFERAFGKVDIIHAHVGFPAGHLAKMLSEAFNIPYIITEQMSPFPHEYYVSGRQNQLLLEAYHHSDRNISISKAQAAEMSKLGIRNIVKIPNLVDESFFQPATSTKSDKEFTFFSLGRLEPQKGMDILLNSFALLQVNAQLRIGGDGSRMDEYRTLAITLGISHKVQFLGELDKEQVLVEFQNCDAFVLASRHESMGVVFAEAMAIGKPVIGTICGGPEEFINKTNGYLVAPEDVKGLTNAMADMIKSHQQFDAGTIRKNFMNQFSSEKVSTQIMEIYTQVLERQSS